MSCCLNPSCPDPRNPNDAERCQACGTVLRLQNRYLALQQLGQGGFGRTFLAADLAQSPKRRCVIKQFFPQQQNWSDRKTASARFYQEAQQLKTLGNHPQIPTLLAYLEQDAQQYLIQEFINGRNLEQELAEEGIFSPAKIREVLCEILPVLQFIHSHQVIHRDVKPANIIRNAVRDRDHGTTLVLVDLGAAKYVTESALAATGTVIGSAEYIAPEQTMGKAVFASDLYSLGVTCIHLLTGMPPFDLFDSSQDRWVWRDYLQQPISSALGRLLDKLLQRATSRRYASADAVLADLIRVRTGAIAPFLDNTAVPSQPAASSDKVWAEDFWQDGEQSKVWAEDFLDAPPSEPSDPVWAEDSTPESDLIWAEEPHMVPRQHDLRAIAEGMIWLGLITSPLLFWLWNSIHASRPAP
jgi:Ca-activated chloride channel family protein